MRILSGVVLLVAALAVAVGWQAAPAAAGASASPVLEHRLVGYSVQHRPIYAYHLGKRLIRPIYLLVGQMHGDEHAGVTLTQSIIHASRAVEGINLWVIPTMNPDGDAAHTRQNAHGVDLNRNWPDNWAHLSEPYYSGPRALSEPETHAMWQFLWWLKPDYLVVLHQPLYGVDTSDSARLDPDFRDALSRNLGLPEKAFLCGGVCHGSMTGWFTSHSFGVDETIEFGWHPSTSYLTGRARDGILSAMHAHWGALSDHDPRRWLNVTPKSGAVRVSGWTYDPDFTSTALSYNVLADGQPIAYRTTGRPSPVINARYHITGTHAYDFSERLHPGSHTICLRYHNLGAGTGYPQACRTVTVPA
jgi:hypothetical protein